MKSGHFPEMIQKDCVCEKQNVRVTYSGQKNCPKMGVSMRLQTRNELENEWNKKMSETRLAPIYFENSGAAFKSRRKPKPQGPPHAP